MWIFSRYKNFRSKKWTKLSPKQRVKSLQKLETDLAQRQRREPAQIFIITEEADNKHGFFRATGRDYQIWLSPILVTDPKQRFQAMATTYHEGRHAFQHYRITNKPVRIFNFTAKKWKKNFKGYIGADYCGVAYGAQALEKDADNFTLAQMNKLNKRFENEIDFIDTINRLEARKLYHVEMAKEKFGENYHRNINSIIKKKSKKRYKTMK